MFASKAQRQLFMFLFEESEIDQNHSLYVWKTLNYGPGRQNLRNDMNQVKNLKSLGFIWKRIANLLGVLPDVVLCDIDFCGFCGIIFDPHISSVVRFVLDRVA